MLGCDSPCQKVPHDINPGKENTWEIERLSAPQLFAYLRLWPLLMDYFNNPLTSLRVSRTMLLPHQLEAALRVLESTSGRFLIADEVGLGKTIEAGLILKELVLKYDFKKILIVVPATLLNQWRHELLTKFNEEFTIITGESLRKDPDIVQRKGKILISLDLAKDVRYRHLFQNQNFDMAIFDEAHRLRRDRHKITQAYAFAELVARRCRVMLLLSATPFRGKLEEIYYLIHLLDQDLLGPLDSFLEEFENPTGGTLRRKIAPVVIRRQKKDVGLFTRRIARTVKLNLSTEERRFYDATTAYVAQEYNLAKAIGAQTRSFVMITLQKLLDSSSYALLTALKKRRLQLEELLTQSLRKAIFNKEDYDRLFLLNHIEDDGETAELIMESQSEPKEILASISDIRKEIEALDQLIYLGSLINQESKLRVLRQTLRELARLGHKKFLIFTQFRSTLSFLQKELSQEFKVEVFHGSLSPREKDLAVERFSQEAEIFILTEAGGEGRNLQMASVLINYDLPWSPLKIEQRIGRIHRYGQSRDVYIINFVTHNTVAEKVLEVLEKKIHLFEEAFGESDILLGMLEDEFNFTKNFAFFLKTYKDKRIKNRELEMVLTKAKQSVAKIERLFSVEFVPYDFSAFLIKENSLLEKDKKNEKRLAEIIKVLDPSLKELGAGIYEFSHGASMGQGSFYRELCQKHEKLDYLVFGHPYLDSLVAQLMQLFPHPKILQLYTDSYEGYYFLVEVNFHTVRKHRRLFAVENTQGQWRLLTEDPSFEIKAELGIKPHSHDWGRLEQELRDFLQPYIEEERQKLMTKLSYDAYFWKKTLNESFDQKREKIQQKLEIQKGKLRWYGDKGMSLALARTQREQTRLEEHSRKRFQEIHNSVNLKTEVILRHVVQLTPEPQ